MSPPVTGAAAPLNLPPSNACPSSPPPVGQNPEQNAQWWSGLSAQEQSNYVAATAGLGNMDGLPVEVRHEANMITLRNDAQTGNDPGNAQALLARVDGSQNLPPDQRIFLLGYTPPGPDGAPDALVIAAIGNPDTADNTAVFVPGTSTNLGSLPGSLDRMGDLKSASETVPNAGSVSTIVWLGYDAPDSIPAAALVGYAEDAAPVLRGFTEGLRASHQGPESHVTVIGHSYGATVVGSADALGGQGTDDGLEADDVIALGSPGMGVESSDRQGWFDGAMVDDVSDMHIGADHFWAGAASDDIVSYTEIHGNSPVDWSFGGQRITTAGADGHSEYWDAGTEALRNQAYIVTGNYDQVATVGRRFG